MTSTVRQLGAPLAIDARRWLMPLLSALVAVATMVLWWRRLAGALVEPLPAGVLAALGLALAAWAGLVRRVPGAGSSVVRNRLLGADWPGLSPLVAHGAAAARWTWPTALTLGCAAALSVRGASPLGLAALWGLPLVELGWSLAMRSTRLPRVVGSASGEPAVAGERNEAVLPADRLTQHWERRRLDDGSETLWGWLLVELQPGQRTATAHVAFCPALPAAPEVEAAVIDGPPGAVEAVQVLPWGARLELHLADRAAGRATARIELTAHAAAGDAT